MKLLSLYKIISKKPYDLSDHVDNNSISGFYRHTHNRIDLELLPNNSA
jgi:hypothetical protein